MSGEILFSLNNHWESKFTGTGKLSTNTFAYAGTWEVTAKELILTVTNASRPESEPIGTIDHLKIIRAEATELVFQTKEEKPQTFFWKRIR